MNASTLLDAIRNSSPELQKRNPDVLKMAWKLHVTHHNGDHQACVSECITDAGLIAEALDKSSRDIPSQGSATELNESLPAIPALEIQEQRLLDYCQTFIEKLRHMLFGSRDAPFGTYAEAVEWIEAKDREQCQPSYEDWREAHRLEKEYMEKIKACQRLIRSRISRPEWENVWRKRILIYRKPPTPSAEVGLPPYADWVPSMVEVFTDPDYIGDDSLSALSDPDCPLVERAPLALLEAVAHHLAESTGFIKQWVVAYILCNEKSGIYLPVALFNLDVNRIVFDREDIRHAWANIKLYTPDLTYEHFRQICTRLRKQWGVQNTKRLNQEQRKLWEEVQRRGGPPEKHQKGTTEFWTDVATALGLGVTWRAAQKRYQQIEKKVTPQRETLAQGQE